MTTTKQYDTILAQLAAGEFGQLARVVFDILKRIPDGCTRLQFIELCYGGEAAASAAQFGLSNSQHDRKVRKAIEELRENFIPVVSSSGAAGYRLDTSPDAVSAMIAEWQSRIDHLNERVRKARSYYNIPEPVYEPATQGRLL
jgi:hypothetical protein